MPTPAQTTITIGVDVGGTFTDLVATDGQTLHILKLPSSPPDFHLAVITAVHQAIRMFTPNEDLQPESPSAFCLHPSALVTHGSTVATNALLQRAGAPIAMITTEGFRDLLLIGRQNRPELYALNVRRPEPITQNCFTVPERLDAQGQIVQPLDESAAHDVINQIKALNIHHVAICFLFSFVNPIHEQRLATLCRSAGLTVTLSSDLLPEFREYERASTTAINATLRPTVERYLQALERGLSDTSDEGRREQSAVGAKREGNEGNEIQSAIDNRQLVIPTSVAWPLLPLRIMHSSGGTLSPTAAAEQAARLILSGPAGGIIGAAYVAKLAGFENVITYDMGGTSTDVATIASGQPQWTTSTTVDGLPVALPMFDIHTVGAGGGSIAYVDAGGALKVGPRSAGAIPGPACYGRGGAEPTVTDANLLLGRIPESALLGGTLELRKDLAQAAIATLARQINKSPTETALGILQIVEANMAAAVRAVTSRRGHDPRDFTLVSFGGAGGLHACAIAESLAIRRVLIPPYAGVLSALGMVVAPPVAEASKTVLHLGEGLDDPRIAAEFGQISGRTMDVIPYAATASVEAWADVRFKGQSHELKVRALRPTIDHIHQQFLAAYTQHFGKAPGNRPIEIVTLRIRRLGHATPLTLPPLREPSDLSRDGRISAQSADVHPQEGHRVSGLGYETPRTSNPHPTFTRSTLLNNGPTAGPVLLLDSEATAYIPPNWNITCSPTGQVVAERS